MTTHAHGDRLRLLFDWAHEDGRRLALWVFVAIMLHAIGWLLFQTRYPHPEPAQISDASLYILLPGSPEAKRLAPYLASADPSLIAPERNDRLGLPEPTIPAYRPSFTAATPELVSLPDPPTHLLPPLLRNFGPVEMNDAPAPPPALPKPAAASEILFSAALQARAPRGQPKIAFTARPGDQLAPARFLIAVNSEGHVLHVLPDDGSLGSPLEDDAAKFLMRLKFSPALQASISWGTATFYWGLDIVRKEPKPVSL